MITKNKIEPDPWDVAMEIHEKKKTKSVEMGIGMTSPGTVVAFASMGKAALGVVDSISPYIDAVGEVYINAEVEHLDAPGVFTRVRRESEMTPIPKDLDERVTQFKERKKDAN